MTKTVPRLGKGLSALIRPKATTGRTPAQAAETTTGSILEIPISNVQPNPNQPRSHFDDETLTELAASIRNDGVIQPIIVRQLGAQSYELIAGERRWRAARLAELQSIPAVIREANPEQSFRLALIENLQRQDLAPLERAAAYEHFLHNFDRSADELAQQLGESRANVSNYLRLLKLQKEIREMLASGQLGMGQARALAGVTHPQQQLALARITVRRNLSVRQVENLVRTSGETKRQFGPTKSADHPAHLAELEEAFSRSLGLKVRLYPGRRKNSGRLVVTFSNLEQFDQLAEHFGASVHLE